VTTVVVHHMMPFILAGVGSADAPAAETMLWRSISPWSGVIEKHLSFR
jgi:hypothetical protein